MEQRTLIDVYNNRMYTVGPGGYEIKLSPGSRVYDLSTSPSGHMILPADCWNAHPHGKNITLMSCEHRDTMTKISGKYEPSTSEQSGPEL